MKNLKTIISVLFLTFLLGSCQRSTKILNKSQDEAPLSNLEHTQDKHFVKKIKPHPVNCFDLPNILEKVGKRDGQNRVREMLPEIDRKNLEIVVSILENCGMPTLKQIEGKHIIAIWLVLQHADNYHRKKYFPLIEKAVENGDLSKSAYALMKDRILVGEGKPQIYGSQIDVLPGDQKKFVVLPIEDPEYVDQRRTEMGLEPINEYLAMWGTSLDIEQKER